MVTQREAVAEAAIQRIDSWLDVHASGMRAALRPAVSPSNLVAAERAVGRTLPADLIAWWSCADGAHSGRHIDAGRLIPPRFDPYPVEQALESRRVWMEVARQIYPADQLQPFLASENDADAGRPCDQWLPAWLPLATDHGGTDLFIDLRGGPLHGCVMTYRKVGGATTGPEWLDVAAMLYDIADRLANDEAELDSSGRISWLT